MGKIVFGSKEIITQSVYPYAYSNGKVVLRVSAREEDASESDLKQLKDNTAPIEYYERKQIADEETGQMIETEEWELKHTYDGYDSGEYVSSYENGVYKCEVTRLGEIERTVRQTAADVAYLSIMSGVNL